jgi:hypothetical protein
MKYTGVASSVPSIKRENYIELKKPDIDLNVKGKRAAM